MMMMDLKKFLPHIFATLTLLLVSAFVFAPNAFNGKVLPQPDNDKARGNAVTAVIKARLHKLFNRLSELPLEHGDGRGAVDRLLAGLSGKKTSEKGS